MGTPVNPDPPVFGNDCAECFAAGRTPASVTLIISGVMQNSHWPHGWPELPNGQYHLPQVGPCLWLYDVPKWRFSFWFLNGKTHLHLTELLWGTAFVTGNRQGCYSGGFEGRGEWDGTPLFGGGASVSWGTSTTTPSLQAIAEILNIPLDPQLNSDMFFSDPDNVHMLYVSHYSQTKLRFKLDIPEFLQYFHLEA